MTGYVMAYGACFGCKRLFYFNPHWVPSFPDPESGERQPLCQFCMNVINARREEAGEEPWPIHPEAYEPLEEASLRL